MNNNKIINALLSALGALIFISFLAFLDRSFEGMIWLIPPFGASMVLVMAVYESPLAKPKNILLGHIILQGFLGGPTFEWGRCPKVGPLLLI